MTVPATEGPVDPSARLRAATRARVALGRAGDALPTAELLAAHAAARDAVHAPLDVDAVVEELRGLGLEVPTATSAAHDRAEYLQRPDLGRRLSGADDLAPGEYDVAFVVADGLSPLAVHRHAAPLLRQVLARLEGWRIAPVVVATQARVAAGDEIGAALGNEALVVLVGERPGMSSTDSPART
ncbi:ethanolamine ammonia-lyase light chain EutC [Pseudonocardia halophobica]|uniref:ethanolamine ammonia-lyase light chain EutC n=1 Tax=Pseudonocardia halophobica TaxID=29401 RepID=UPI003D94D8C6